MLLRISSVLTLLLGAAISASFYVLSPRGQDFWCLGESTCQSMSQGERIFNSLIPLAVSAIWVTLAWLVAKRSEKFARLLLIVPLVLGIVPFIAIFAAAALA